MPASADAATCRVFRDGSRVCYDVAPPCASASYTPPFTDFGVVAGECVTASVGPGTGFACVEAYGGFWTLSGFYGLDEEACAAYFPGPGGTCVAAAGRSHDLQWYTDPVCLP